MIESLFFLGLDIAHSTFGLLGLHRCDRSDLSCDSLGFFLRETSEYSQMDQMLRIAGDHEPHADSCLLLC